VAGTSRAIELRVPVADVAGGLSARVDTAGAILECDESDDAEGWSGGICP
jgi:hypothetical protein